MNDSELNRTLKSAEPPPRTDEYWADFPGEVARQLTRPLPPERRATNWLPRLAWAGGLAAVCGLIGFVLGHQWGQPETASNNGQVLQNEKVIREVMAMFPNRVRAIVQDEHGVQLVLSDQADVPTSPPIYVHICDGRQCSSLVTFSGQELELTGQKVTILSDARGGIILTGNQFVWSSTARNYAQNHLKIEARSLAPVVM